MRKSDLPLVALDLRRAGELVASYGEHLWDATRDMTPGPRAAHTDPNGKGGWRTETVTEDGADVVVTVPNDPAGEQAITHDGTETLHEELRDWATQAQRVARDGIRLMESLRYDRRTPTADPASDAEYCTHHLTTLGTAEPRYRGDECRACYDFRTAYHRLPTLGLLRLHHEGKKWTEKAISDELTAVRQPKKKRRRKAA